MPASNILRVWFGSMVLECFAFSPFLMAQDKPHAGPAQAYRIHIGDVLQISVYQHPELSRKVVVSGEASHILPENSGEVSRRTTMDALLREMKVADLTALDVAQLVSEALKTRYTNPQVTVVVVSMMISPLPASTLPSPRLRDTPSLERLPDCCVVREGH